MPFVNYRYLESEGIMPNRMTLARAIDQLGFPKPIALGQQRFAWDLDEVQAWLGLGPRRAPKTGATKPKQGAADASLEVEGA